MKNIVITGLLATLVIFNPLAFLPAAAQPVAVGFSPFVDSTFDIDWSNEAEFVYFLQQAADEDLRQMNDQVAQQLMDQVSSTDWKYGSAGIVALTGIVMGTGITVWAHLKGSRGWWPVGILLTALSIPATAIAGHYFWNRNRVLSAQELREVMGEELVTKVEELQNILRRVYGFLSRKDLCLEIPASINPRVMATSAIPGDEDVVATFPKEWENSSIAIDKVEQHAISGKGPCVVLSNPGPVRQLILQHIFSTATAKMNLANTAAQNHMAPTSYDDLATTLARQTIVLPGSVTFSIPQERDIHDIPGIDPIPNRVLAQATYELPLAGLVEAAQELVSSGDLDNILNYWDEKIFLNIRGQ